MSIAPPIQMQAWVVYYDADRGLNEVRAHGALFDRISLFAYELSPDGTPQPAPNMPQMIPQFLRYADERGFEPWVTVVNDVRFGRDSAILKDTGLVHDILSDEVRRENHARALAERVRNDGFAGLHLDYERVAVSDSSEFRAFVHLLNGELVNRGLELEVVVEPSYGPVPGPNTTSVSVMGYDLHGPHSGPGPRATPEFVAGLQPRARGDSDSAAGLAIALSGFSWQPGGEVVPVDWAASSDLSVEGRTRQRNAADGVPSARLDDGTEIWFEDPESILQKWHAAWGSGFRRLLLWRLGGNDDRLFSMLRDLRAGSSVLSASHDRGG
jgi:spore germination protein YaaH